MLHTPRVEQTSINITTSHELEKNRSGRIVLEPNCAEE